MIGSIGFIFLTAVSNHKKKNSQNLTKGIVKTTRTISLHVTVQPISRYMHSINQCLSKKTLPKWRSFKEK